MWRQKIGFQMPYVCGTQGNTIYIYEVCPSFI